jgi:transcriptional regulator with XRE-family HTH domain
MKNLETVGKLIRRLRKDKKLSLRDLAKIVNMSHVNITHIENDRVSTNTQTLIGLAKALDCNPDKMLAVANEVGDDIKGIIQGKPDAVPKFLRTTKNFNNRDWERLEKMAADINKGKK